MSASRSSRSRSHKPAETIDGREARLVSLAFDMAEKQLEDGTASSQLLTQVVRLGTAREQLEREKIQNDNLLLSARVDQIKSAQRMEELYGKALDAMRQYSGDTSPTEEELDDYDY